MDSAKHRPPFIIFLLCVAAFGIALFSLSVFVAQSEKIRNPDVLDWNTLLSKLTKLEFCLPAKANLKKYNNVSATNLYHADLKLDQWTQASLNVKVSSEFSQAFHQVAKTADNDKPVLAKGQIEVRHLGKRGVRPKFLNETILILFVIPPPQSPSSACLEIQGSKVLLSHLTDDSNDTTTCSDSFKGLLPLATPTLITYICSRFSFYLSRDFILDFDSASDTFF